MIFFSCKKDDTNITNIPLEDLSQQYTLENDSIIQFMKSHFFNYDDFNDLSPNDSPEIVFDSIIGDNIDKTPIYDQVSTLQISVKDADDNLVNIKSIVLLLSTYGYKHIKESSELNSLQKFLQHFKYLQ